MDHSLIDRSRIRDLLVELASTITVPANAEAAAVQEDLNKQTDSGLERDFLEWLRTTGRKMPDRAQVHVASARSKPDFVYDLHSGPVAVFVDGPSHIGAQAERDIAAEERLIDEGWMVVRFRHDDDWTAVASKYPGVFGVTK